MREKIKKFLQNHKSSLILSVVVVIILVGLAWVRSGGNSIPTPSDVANVARESVENTKKLAASVFGGEFNINEEKFIVDPNKLVGGGPPKDGISSIDKPKFESVGEASKWMRDDDLVFGIFYKGEARVYPQRILVWYEIVNEKIKGDPILISYCPLCLSAIAFERKVKLSDG